MKLNLSDFYATDFCQYSCYDNLRKIASAIDGQKNASRKLLYTVLEKNIKEPVKVLELAASVVSFAGYLHGDCSGVAVTLGQDFAGTNNIPLLQKKGNFGTRFAHDASAPRYIFTYGSEMFYKLFKKEDCNILINQEFEGKKIEPMFYVPTLPIILINGSEGVSTGFAQKILSRKPENIIKAINALLKHTTFRQDWLTPYFNGFNGIVERGDNNWLIKGKIEKIGVNKIRITEVPIGYDLKSYLKVLDNLEDSKFIQGYKDLSDNDKFLFEVQIPSKTLKELSENDLLQKLKLVKSITENFTVMDENNKIRVFESALDLLKYYIDVKLRFLSKRKQYLLDKYTSETNMLKSKYEFIKRIIDGTLVIYKRKKADIIKDLDKISDIIKIDDSYDYLLNMQIASFTSEKLKKLQDEIKVLHTKFKELNVKSEIEMWSDDLCSIS